MSTFPQPWKSTVSHWQATNRGPGSLYLHNEKAVLPETADIVIVGGGMMGAAMAYFLTRAGGYGENKKIVCVEAKDVASGATGRNGGHVGPKTYLAWHDLQQPYPLGQGCSEDEATRITQNERDNLDLVQEIVEREQLDVDFWRGRLVETHHSAERTRWSKEQYHAWLAARKRLGLSGHDTSFIDDPAEAERLSRFKGATSAHLRPGGSVHSHKLCTALMQKALDSTTSDFSLHSWTPVSGFPEQVEKGRWRLHTSKGPITAKEVILCTNAHTANFFDKRDMIHHHITPFSGQCATITPPPSCSGAHRLKNTYNMLDGHYLVTTASGEMVLGGGIIPLVKEGKMSYLRVGEVDDSEKSLNPHLTKNLSAFMRKHFIDWGEEAYGEGLTRTWVGIMGSSKDELPLVGRVPGKEGLHLCAGFSGHGMSRIFTTARGYADTLKTGTWDEKLLPRGFELTPERLRRAHDTEEEFKRSGREIVVVDGEVLLLKDLRPSWSPFWNIGMAAVEGIALWTSS